MGRKRVKNGGYRERKEQTEDSGGVRELEN